MHYAPDAFSIRPGDPRFYTVTPKAPGVYIGQRQGLSPYDWEHIKRVYCPSPFNSEIQSARTYILITLQFVTMHRAQILISDQKHKQ